jgi:heme-degrading monooxygenase HmoA
MEEIYSYIWEFRVKADSEVAFEKAYGPEGVWVRLFSKADGYLRTELHRDLEVPGRYITVDFWKSEAAFQAFRARFVAEFDELDARCEELTEAETPLGSFKCTGPPA